MSRFFRQNIFVESFRRHGFDKKFLSNRCRPVFTLFGHPPPDSKAQIFCRKFLSKLLSNRFRIFVERFEPTLCRNAFGFLSKALILVCGCPGGAVGFPGLRGWGCLGVVLEEFGLWEAIGVGWVQGCQAWGCLEAGGSWLHTMSC